MGREAPKAIWEGTFELFGVRLRCYVLDDQAQTRIIHADDLVKLFGVMGQEGNCDEEELREFILWQRGGR